MNIDERLRDALGEYRDQARVSPELFDRIEARTQRTVVSRRTLVPAMAALLVVITIAAALVIRTGGPDDARVSSGRLSAGGCAGKVYVTNGTGTDGVSVIDAATGRVSATIPVGHSPGAVAITPDGKHAYVANNNNGTVTVITTRTGTVSATIPVGGDPSGLAITPDGKHVYVANANYTKDPPIYGGYGQVSVITTATGASLISPAGTVSAIIPVDAYLEAVAITPDGKHAYVGGGDGQESVVFVITTATGASLISPAGAVSATIPVGAYAVAITPDGKHAYVTDGSGAVSVIDTATGVVSSTITIGYSPKGVTITPDGKHAYVTNYNNGTVTVITTATGTVSARDRKSVV